MQFISTRHSAFLAATLTLMTACGSSGPPTARLADSLGHQRITEITDTVLQEHLASRSTLEAEIIVDASFWPPVRSDIARTVGPSEGAAEFLRIGFRGFLHSFETHLLENTPPRNVLIFNGAEVMRFLRIPRPRGCRGSPCDVPPCCGNGVRCWPCS